MRRFSNLAIPRNASEGEEVILSEFDEEESLALPCTARLESGVAKVEELGSGSAYEATRR